MSMNLEQFLEKLEQTPRDWQLMHGYIRRRGESVRMQCPISSLCDMWSSNYPQAAKEIGLDSRDSAAIVRAADSSYGDPVLRAKLLKACGL